MADSLKEYTKSSASRRFLCEFNYQGSTWMFEIWADDWPDANRKLHNLKTNARLMGEAMMQIKVPGAFGRAIGWLTRWRKP